MSMRVWAFFIMSALLFGCTPSEQTRDSKDWYERNGKLKVLSTTAMIDDLVRQIGGELVDRSVLIQGNLDPHSYQLVKGDGEKFDFADIVFYNGLGLEHGPSLHHRLEHTAKALALGDLILKDRPDLALPLKGQVDPHVWMDISIWAKAVPIIEEALAKKDPKNASVYHEAAMGLKSKLQSAHDQVKSVMRAVPSEKRYLVTSHDAFNYFTRAYMAEDNELEGNGWEKRFSAPEGLAPESQLSALHIQQIIDHVAKYQIHVLFPESNVSKDSIRKIVQAGNEKGLQLQISDAMLYADAMAEPGQYGDAYPEMVLYDSIEISKNLLGPDFMMEAKR